MQLFLWRNLSQRECVGASVTIAEVRSTLCQGEVYTLIVTLPQLGPLCDLAGNSKFTSLPGHPATATMRSMCPPQAIQLITRLRIAQPHQLGNLCLICRILMDCKFQELAELLVELLLAILLLDNVLQTLGITFRTKFSCSLAKSRSSAEPPARYPKEDPPNPRRTPEAL